MAQLNEHVERRRRSRSSRRAPILCLWLLGVGSCLATPGPLVPPGPPGPIPVRPRIEDRRLAVALFPVQVVPDILANAVVALTPGNLWPIQYALYPLSVLIWGVGDAWEGRPFWDPTALYD